MTGLFQNRIAFQNFNRNDHKSSICRIPNALLILIRDSKNMEIDVIN